MNRIDKLFLKLKESGERGLFIYVTAGDPDLETTFCLVRAAEAAGADLVELGVPFSDPMADGPVIQRASRRALEAGTDLKGILELVARLRLETSIPLVLMSYYNPVLSYGLERLAGEAALAGVDGLIIPDLPVEENGPLLEASLKEGLHLIPLAAPTSTRERLAKIAASARGFIYCVSLTGVTGAREGLPPHIEEFISRARQECHKPLAIGFGISTPEQVALISRLGDAVIVGSAVVSLVEQHLADRERMLEEVTRLVRQLKNACRGGRHRRGANPLSRGCSS